MSFFQDLPDARVNITPSVADGSKGVVFPSSSNTVENIPLPSCRGCALLGTHNSPCVQKGMKMVFGNSRNTGMPETNLISVDCINKFQSALWLMGYVNSGVPYQNYLYNLGFGTANNISQQTAFQIIAANGSTLTLRGPNPKRIFSPISYVNTNFPFEAPREFIPLLGWSEAQYQANKYNRILNGGFAHSLPLGSLIYFQYPSVLFQKVYPYIEHIDFPVSDSDTVDFDVRLSCSVSRALDPYDLQHPAAKYFIDVFYYYVKPEDFRNIQSSEEQLFTYKEKKVLVGDLVAASGILHLTRSDNANGKVLTPDTNGTIRLEYKESAGYSTYNDSVYDLLTVDYSGGYRSSLDLNALIAAKPTLEYVVVKYHPEAASGDTPLYPMPKTCSQDQLLGTEDGRRCTNQNCSKYVRGDYLAGNCWKTYGTDNDADGFHSGVEGGNYYLQNGLDPSLYNGWWNSETMQVVQNLAGESNYRNFSFETPAHRHPSLLGCVGGYHLQVPAGKFSTRRPLFLPQFGQLRQYSDAEGTHLELVNGLYEARGNWYLDEAGNWQTKSLSGALKQYADGWTSRNDVRGNALQEVPEMFPANSFAARHLYTGELIGGNLNAAKKLSAGTHQVYATGMNKSLEDTEVLAIIGGLV
jgi:hypothetical protein